MALSKIHHVAVVVEDADVALQFYRDTLGLAVAKDEIIEDQGVRGILLPVGDAEVELIQPVRDDTGVAKFLASKGEGFHHICFQSDAVDADLAAAAECGCKMIDAKSRPGLAGMIGFIHPKANHGVLIEYAQPPAGETHHAGAPAGIKATGLDHISVLVHDLDTAVETYTSHFPYEVAFRQEFPEMGGTSAFLKTPNALIELMAPTSEDENHPLRQRGEGVQLVGLRVESVADAVAHLRGQGVTADDPAELAVAGGTVRYTSVPSEATHGLPLTLIEAI